MRLKKGRRITTQILDSQWRIQTNVTALWWGTLQAPLAGRVDFLRNEFSSVLLARLVPIQGRGESVCGVCLAKPDLRLRFHCHPSIGSRCMVAQSSLLTPQVGCHGCPSPRSQCHSLISSPRFTPCDTFFYCRNYGSYYLKLCTCLVLPITISTGLDSPSSTMFDHFTFASSSVDTTARNAAECTSAEISPYTSRCSSPKMRPETGRLFNRDSRFDIYLPPRHSSVTALTAQLEHHAISELPGSESPFSMASPADSTSDQDEGFFDGPETPSTPYSDYSADFDPNLWDLNMTDPSVTSSPRPSLSLEAQASSSFTQRRRHRQALVRLQCLANKAPDIAMLFEECHPSELGTKSRSNSTISLGAYASGRIEKERPTSTSSARKPIRQRKRATR